MRLPTRIQPQLVVLMVSLLIVNSIESTLFFNNTAISSEHNFLTKTFRSPQIAIMKSNGIHLLLH